MTSAIPTFPTVTAPNGVLDVTVVYLNPEQHCCQESSDEEACPEDEGCQTPGTQTPPTPGPRPILCKRKPGKDIMTSGYSSVSSTSPTNSVDGSSGDPPQSTSVLSLGSDSNTHPCHHQAKKPCLQCRPPTPPESTLPQRQVKRQNLSTHSDEDMNLGFLKL